MKKIFYVNNIRFPTEKAHGIQIAKMCESFAKHGYEVELVIPRRHTDIKLNPFEYYSIEPNFTVTRLPCIDFSSFGRVGFYIQSLSFLLVAVAYSIFRNGTFYTRDQAFGAVLPLFFKKVFWESHSAIDSNLAFWALRNTAGTIVITNKIKEFYVSHGFPAERMLVEHDAFDPRLFKEVDVTKLRKKIGLSLDKVIVSYVGKYKTNGVLKGVDKVIVGLAEASKKSSLEFCIVGPEEEELEEIRALAVDAGFDIKKLNLIPHLPNKEALDYVKASDILLLPYPNKRNYSLFMSPLKLFEYMASGNAIVASKLPSLTEVLDEKSALFVTPDDYSAMGEAVMMLCDNEELRGAIGARAKELSQYYTWDLRAQRIIDFIEER